jgi:hypothetical protein
LILKIGRISSREKIIPAGNTVFFSRPMAIFSDYRETKGKGDKKQGGRMSRGILRKALSPAQRPGFILWPRMTWPAGPPAGVFCLYFREAPSFYDG